MNNLLFSHGYLSDILNVRNQQIEAEIGRLEETGIKQTGTERLIEFFVSKYEVKAPRLRLIERFALEPKQIKMDSGRFYKEPLNKRQIDGTEYTIGIPFDGEPGLFNYCGSSSTSVTPRGEIHGQVLWLKYQRPLNWEIKSEVDRELENIEVYLKSIQNDVEDYNRKMSIVIGQFIDRKKRDIEARKEMISRLGIPIRHAAIENQDMARIEKKKTTEPKKSETKASIKDVFLCHASEDKNDCILPFSKELTGHGITFWLDEAEIKWGDGLAAKINEGLKMSTYVLVFLSDRFLKRDWPKKELEAALSKENSSGQIVVLPLVIGNPCEIIKEYPILADKKYMKWEDGILKLIEELNKRLNR